MPSSHTTTLVLICFASGLSFARQPNIILFLADDLGWGDLSVYGHPSQEWGSVDEMALQGLRFTNWYSADNVCTPSRAALLTGRYPFRSGMAMRQQKMGTTGRNRSARVILETSSAGLPEDDVTLAEALKGSGYSTGMVGKWHLGINAFNSADGSHLPDRHGFDYVGTILPWTLIQRCTEDDGKPLRNRCFVYKNRIIVQQPIDLSTLTGKFVDDAKEFVYTNRDRPFFLYFPFGHTHTPMFSSPKFKNSSRRGRYGDNVNEMSWAVGEVLKHVRDLDLHQNTLTIFTSDHGAATEFCTHGGSSGVFKGGKYFPYEGGLRVPMIVTWPGTIPRGTVHAVGSHLDLLPSLIHISNGSLPAKHLDGVNRADALLGHQQNSKPEEVLFFYSDDLLQAVRFGPFKIYFYTCGSLAGDYFDKICKNGTPRTRERDVGCGTSMRKEDPPLMFNVDVDPAETFPLQGRECDAILAKVKKLVRKQKMTEFDRVEPRLGAEFRYPLLSPCCNPPYCFCNYGNIP